MKTNILFKSMLVSTLAAMFSFGAISCSSDDKEDDLIASSEKKITSFSVNSLNATIDESKSAITLLLPFGTDLTKLSPVVKVSDKATVSPKSETEVNLSEPVKYTVTAEDKSKKEYTVTVTADKNNEGKFYSFAIGEVNGTINEEAKTVEVVLPKGTNLNGLTPTAVISTNATVSPALDKAQDFTEPVKYTISPEKGEAVVYTVTVLTEKSKEAAIKSFTVEGVAATINEEAKTIRATLPYGPDIKALKPVIVISEDATISPKTGVATDFTSEVLYIVTAEDGTTKVEYKVSVSIEKFDAKIDEINTAYFIGGDAIELKGKFAKSGNVVEIKGADGKLVKATIVSEGEAAIKAKLPTSVNKEGVHTLVLTANGTVVEYKENITVFNAGKPVIFFTDKLVYTINKPGKQEPITVTGRNMTPLNSSIASYLKIGQYKMAAAFSADGTTASLFGIDILDAGKHKVFVSIDGVESNILEIEVIDASK